MGDAYKLAAPNSTKFIFFLYSSRKPFILESAERSVQWTASHQPSLMFSTFLSTLICSRR
jgi:hypothetical protein